jgi:hypothetical protein
MLVAGRIYDTANRNGSDKTELPFFYRVLNYILLIVSIFLERFIGRYCEINDKWCGEWENLLNSNFGRS